MVRTHRPALVAAFVSLVLASPLQAQPASQPSLAQPASQPAKPTPKNPALAAKLPDKVSPLEGEPNVKRTVIEDDGTRIEEVRVRGQAQRVVVTNKNANIPAWEIRTDTPGRVGAVESRLPRDSANPRVWSVLSF
jgi:hypothetical protein